jgi:tRNA(fMet)-specific endonuclease VapC
MTRYLFDTGIAGDYLNRRNGVFDRTQVEVARGNRVGLGMPVLAELYYGIELSATRDKNLQRLHRALSHLVIWPFTDVAAAEYGRLAAHLKRTGRPMQPIDIMIAAIALTLGRCTVVSVDTDFAAVPDLSVENWVV